MNKRLIALLAAMWIVREFTSVDDMVLFLNDLSPKEAISAKTLTLDSRVTAKTFGLIFQTDRPEHYLVQESKPRKKNLGE